MDDKKFNKILNILKRELSEEGVPPTNNVGGGQIAGTVEASVMIHQSERRRDISTRRD